MAVLFRPVFDYDTRDWLPALQKELAAFDFRTAPAIGDPADIHYLVGWKLWEGDKTRWPNLKAVLPLSTGVDRYIGNPEFPHPAKLVRMIEPGLNQGMAEYVASYVLRYHRDHDQWQDAQTRQDWRHDIPKLASQRRIGFLGLGNLARSCIAMLAPFGFQVSGWSRAPKTIPGVQSFAGADQLKPFLAGCEILICLLPLTAQTENILNHDTLSCLPAGACLINPARGKELVDEDLIALLDKGHVRYAALDVFRQEPLPADHPFWRHPRIHLTPHIAAVTIPQTGAQALRQVIETIEAGGTPAGLVDFTQGY
ncbi:MAG TPA: glyoxylate/hydroxypyruvate reductase A [Micavibrio sp.]